uniref:Uncharacterized protein n=1 Tax=Virgibacillus oceani TaxID=1479511 RepID=A0A917LW31_9BACI|nr:hypothetical protein GCM10011398_00250 [Virgibacillus oceani]
MTQQSPRDQLNMRFINRVIDMEEYLKTKEVIAQPLLFSPVYNRLGLL